MKEDGGKDCFAWLKQFVVSIEDDISRNIKCFQRVFSWFEKYFQEGNMNFSWI